MCLLHTDFTTINVPVAAGHNGVSFVEQLLDDLINKALSHDFN